jgi:hypothetical protein
MKKQDGIALPVALILFVVMLMGALYVARSSNSAAMMVSNLAYQRSLSRTSDLGLLSAYDWLTATHAVPANANQLNGDVSAQGYVASFSFAVPQLTPADAAFWTGSRTITNIDGNGNDVQYVIHRMCSLKLAFSAGGNRCVTSSFQPAAAGGVAPGASLGVGNEEVINSVPLLHYLVTARVVNARKGATVINQLNVMMGA